MSTINKKYVIYQGSGGLVHMLGGLVYCIEWCIKNKHFLIIDVKNHICFKHTFNKFFYIKEFNNYSEDYNVIPSTITHFHRISLEVFNNNNANLREGIPGYWINNNYYRVSNSLDSYKINEVIKIYIGHGGNNMYNIIKYIGINKEIVDSFIEKKLNIEYIGIHFRNTDRKNSINKFISEINKNEKTFFSNTLYLATDDINAYDNISKNINKNIIQYTIPFNSNGLPIHFANDNKMELIMNVLLDIYMLYYSNRFIPSPESLVSRLVLAMKRFNKTLWDQNI